jgi:tetratricopeptide (TPR) repeat protein
MRCFTDLSNIFLFGLLVPFSIAAEEAILMPLDHDNVGHEHHREEKMLVERQLQTARNHIQEGRFDLALATYEELICQDFPFTPESHANILGQYVWLQLQLDAPEPTHSNPTQTKTSAPPSHKGSTLDLLLNFLLLKIQSEPELLHYLPIWEALWNIIQMLSLHGQFEKALQFFQNVKNIANDIPSEEVSIYNLFVETYLLFQCHYEQTSRIKAKELLERYHVLQDPVLREHIYAYLLLYLGELEMLMGNEEIGLLHLQILQRHFPRTANDIRSRIFLATWYMKHHAPQKAQEILLEFIQRHPQDPSIPRLLYVLSQHIRQQGFQFYNQAIHYLEIIANSHVHSEFYVPTKLLEGELLRELHHFFGAQLLYEDLLKKSTLSPTLKALIQLLRIRCILALHPQEHIEEEKAISLLSSIVDTPQLPKELRAEIQFSQMLLLFEHQRFSEAKQITNRVVSDFNANASPSAKECYWIKRILRIAQRIAKFENDTENERKLLEFWERLKSH